MSTLPLESTAYQKLYPVKRKHKALTSEENSKISSSQMVCMILHVEDTIDCMHVHALEHTY